jgi:uncharacterized protein
MQKEQSMEQSKSDREELCRLLHQFKEEHGREYHLLALGFFGSFARGEADAESDVDIVFETDAPNLFRTARMREELEAFLGRPVDMVRLKGLRNLRMKKRIEQESVYV